MKRNFLHVHFSDKLKPLRIGPFKTIDKIFEFTYEVINQDGYTSHIHRKHLVPYHPKEPINFPVIQKYFPQINDNNNDDNKSYINDPIKSFDSFNDEEQSVEYEKRIFTNSNKETYIASTIDFQMEPFHQCSSFPSQQNKQKTKNTNPEDHSDIHDYDNYINPRRHTYNRYNFRPQPRKDYRLFLDEKELPSISRNSCWEKAGDSYS